MSEKIMRIRTETILNSCSEFLVANTKFNIDECTTKLND